MWQRLNSFGFEYLWYEGDISQPLCSWKPSWTLHKGKKEIHPILHWSSFLQHFPIVEELKIQFLDKSIRTFTVFKRILIVLYKRLLACQTISCWGYINLSYINRYTMYDVYARLHKPKLHRIRINRCTMYDVYARLHKPKLHRIRINRYTMYDVYVT